MFTRVYYSRITGVSTRASRPEYIRERLYTALSRRPQQKHVDIRERERDRALARKEEEHVVRVIVLGGVSRVCVYTYITAYSRWPSRAMQDLQEGQAPPSLRDPPGGISFIPPPACTDALSLSLVYTYNVHSLSRRPDSIAPLFCSSLFIALLLLRRRPSRLGEETSYDGKKTRQRVCSDGG